MTILIIPPPDSASKRHKLLYNIFINSEIFKNMRIIQEVPIQKLVPDYPNGRHKADWYIQPLRTIIEVMGQQHRHIATFGNMSKQLAKQKLIQTNTRDTMKREALLKAGYNYIEIWYDEDLTEQAVIAKISDACNS